MTQEEIKEDVREFSYGGVIHNDDKCQNINDKWTVKKLSKELGNPESSKGIYCELCYSINK